MENMRDVTKSDKLPEQESKESIDKLPDAFIQAENRWKKIRSEHKNAVGGYRFNDYEILQDQERRVEVFKLALNLVEKIKESNITDVVLLDKSARPIATILREIWLLESDKPIPSIHFINIGREKLEYEDKRGVASGDSVTDFASSVLGIYTPELKLSPEEIANSTSEELRKVIAPNDPDYFDKIRKRYTKGEDEHSVFFGKHVLIVDDFSDTGTSLALAKKVFDSAFKSEDVETETIYFDPVEKDGGGGMPWSHGATINQQGSDKWWRRKWDIPTQGITGVADSNNPADILSRRAGKQWQEEQIAPIVKEAEPLLKEVAEKIDFDKAYNNLSKIPPSYEIWAQYNPAIKDQVKSLNEMAIACLDELKNPSKSPREIIELFSQFRHKFDDEYHGQGCLNPNPRVRAFKEHYDKSSDLKERYPTEKEFAESVWGDWSEWFSTLSEVSQVFHAGPINFNIKKVHEFIEEISASEVNRNILREELKRVVLEYYFSAFSYNDDGSRNKYSYFRKRPAIIKSYMAKHKIKQPSELPN